MELLTRFLANLGYVKAEAPRENKPAPTAPISNTAPAISLANKDAEATIVIMAIHQVDEMEGVLFERFLKAVFEQQGYEAELTPFYDWGADLVLQKNGQKTIVQAKRWKTRVGQQAVQEIVAAKAKYRAEHAMVVTNNYYHTQAQELGKLNGVEMWDRRNLEGHLRRFSEVIIPPEEAGACCAICGKAVTAAVVEYCQKNEHKFGGKTLCFDHQPRQGRPRRRTDYAHSAR